MYIEFSLPRGAGGTHAAQASYIIERALEIWAEQYRVSYKTKIIKQTKRVTFDDDTYYSLFAMTWNLEREYVTLGRWRIVSDLNNKIEFDSPV